MQNYTTARQLAIELAIPLELAEMLFDMVLNSPVKYAGYHTCTEAPVLFRDSQEILPEERCPHCEELLDPESVSWEKCKVAPPNLA